MRFADLTALSERLAQTRKRNEKIAAIAECIAAMSVEERAVGVMFLAGQFAQGKLGLGYAQLKALGDVPASAEPQLEIADVDRAFSELAADSGAGSTGRRSTRLRALFEAATAPEQRQLARLMLGELRQGALESVVLDALARAAGVPAPLVRRAQMLAANLGVVAQAALSGGQTALQGFDIAPLAPVQPMLAEPAASVGAALAQLGTAAFELKLDGARIQAHKQGDTVRVFTRSLQDVSERVPEVSELFARLTARDLILDGEAIAIRPDGRPLPFQDTMRRFGKKLDIASARTAVPLSLFFFDCLYCDGESLLDQPTEERVARMRAVLPPEVCVERLVTSDEASAEAFVARALDLGHEGAMAKALDAPYAAGSRGASWLKLKLAHTLDLVVLAAEWGSGRRQGTLSNLHLGARDAEHGGFVMLGKTFKGLTDELLRYQTEALLQRETHRDAHTVYVRPELVVEIALNDVQTSPHYPAGLALRFARVKRYRPDKSALEADTLERVRALHALQRN
jgi:DNA ligase-1